MARPAQRRGPPHLRVPEAENSLLSVRRRLGRRRAHHRVVVLAGVEQEDAPLATLAPPVGQHGAAALHEQHRDLDVKPPHDENLRIHAQ